MIENVVFRFLCPEAVHLSDCEVFLGSPSCENAIEFVPVVRVERELLPAIVDEEWIDGAFSDGCRIVALVEYISWIHRKRGESPRRSEVPHCQQGECKQNGYFEENNHPQPLSSGLFVQPKKQWSNQR